MRQVYLDNNATTKPIPEVVQAVSRALEEAWGNPSSTHGAGEEARRMVEEARANVAQLLRCRPTEVIFTSCATESINGALAGCLRAVPEGQRPRMLTSTVEHEATFEVGHGLERALGAEMVQVPVDTEGRLDLDRLEAELKKAPTHLVSLMLANNETGVVFPIAEAARLAHEHGAAVHVDGVQGVGKREIDVEALGADYLSLSGHKFHAPKGVGVLYAKRNAQLVRFLDGAGQESGRRGGTENVPGIVGIGAAAAHMARGIAERREHLMALTRRLEEGILALGDVRLNGAGAERLPGTVSASFAGIEGAAIVLTVAREGVCVSAGSACHAGQYGGSHVMQAMNLPFEYLYGTVRFSCCSSTTMADVEHALEATKNAVSYLRGMNAPPAPEATA